MKIGDKVRILAIPQICRKVRYIRDLYSKCAKAELFQSWDFKEISSNLKLAKSWVENSSWNRYGLNQSTLKL
jgi:hypothetical protein